MISQKKNQDIIQKLDTSKKTETMKSGNIEPNSYLTFLAAQFTVDQKDQTKLEQL
jgi:hypothetical protein